MGGTATPSTFTSVLNFSSGYELSLRMYSTSEMIISDVIISQACVTVSHKPNMKDRCSSAQSPQGYCLFWKKANEGGVTNVENAARPHRVCSRYRKPELESGVGLLLMRAWYLIPVAGNRQASTCSREVPPSVASTNVVPVSTMRRPHGPSELCRRSTGGS